MMNREHRNSNREEMNGNISRPYSLFLAIRNGLNAGAFTRCADSVHWGKTLFNIPFNLNGYFNHSR
jgi:hypothetical protein